jgi:hypothetical protein
VVIGIFNKEGEPAKIKLVGTKDIDDEETDKEDTPLKETPKTTQPSQSSATSGSGGSRPPYLLRSLKILATKLSKLFKISNERKK